MARIYKRELLKGQTKETNTCGVVEVLEDLPKDGRKLKVKVRFIDTGYVADVYVFNYRVGKIKDRFKKDFIGRYLGNKVNLDAKKHLKVKTLRDSMFQRVLKDPLYSDVSICERWYSYELFCLDIISMKNWNTKGYDLDKDMLSDGKLYSPETCHFIPKELNRGFRK